MPLTEQISQLATQPIGTQQGTQQGLGGPGIDTPQEEQAIQMLTQGAQLFRQAAETDPSIRIIIDKLLMDGFNQITKHYGMEEEGKLAIQQGLMEKRKQDTLRRAGPPGGGAGMGSGAPPGPPMATPPSDMQPV